MHSKATVIVASVLALMITAACGENRQPSAPSPVSNPAPNDPAPNPPSPNPPAPTPNPPAPTPNPPAPTPNPPAPTPGEPIVFTPDTVSPESRSYSLQPAGTVEGDFYVALHATDFGQDAVNMVRATITYDPAVVSVVSYASGDSWMRGFGHDVTFKVTKSGSNMVKVSADMASASAGASGSGMIVKIRFRKVGSGSSRLEFADAKAYDAGYNNSLQATHGGTLIVQ